MPSTTLKESPYFMVHGRDVKLPSLQKFNIQEEQQFHSLSEYCKNMIKSTTEIFENANVLIEEKQQKMKEKYDSSRNYTRSNLDIGDLVLLRRFNPDQGQAMKLLRPWDGPYRVTKLDGSGHAQITSVRNPTDVRNVSIEHLKFFYETRESQLGESKELDIFDIEDISADKQIQGETWYLIKWKGFTKRKESWAT